MKKIIISIIAVVVVLIIVSYMVIHFSNGMSLHSAVEKYKKIAIDYTIEQLKSREKYDESETYTVYSVRYEGKDDSGDEIPYSTMKFKIGKHKGYIVTMEKNPSGEFEIIGFESFDSYN